MAHHKVKLNDYKERKGEEGRIDVETDGGIFTILPPELWPDEVVAGKVDDLEAAKLLLEGGAERYVEFVAAGGSAAIIAALVQEYHGESLGN